MPGWFQQAGNKIGGFFQDPAKVTAKAFEVGPPGGKTPQINPAQVAPPIQIENPYAAAGAGAATAQKSFADALANYSGLGQAGVANLMGQLAGPQNLEGLGATGREAISGLIGQLQSQAAGQAGPGSSLAQALLQQGLTQNIAGVRSQLASQRGLSPAIRARLAAQQTAALGGQTAQQAGIMGLQQQLAAIDRLGSLGMGATDIAQKQQEATRAQLGQLAGGAASLGAEGALRGYGQLSQSDVTMREIQARTGLGEKEIAAKIAEANQAAAAGDKQRATNIVTSILGGGAQLGSAYVTQKKAHGGRIDGEAPYAGDTPKNDIVPAQLSPGEIVIPRSAAGSKKAAKAFIEALDDWDEEPSYGKVLKARQKKNYADGGKVEFPLGGPYAPMNSEKISASYNQEIPVAQKMKQSFDQFLTERVVEPLAQRGYPTLGAALATVPSVAADVMIPSTTGELQAGVIPFPGAKLTKAAKEATKSAKREIIENFVSGMASMGDDVDISRLKPELYKKYAKDIEKAKKQKVLDELEQSFLEKQPEIYKKSTDLLSDLVGSRYGYHPVWSIESLAENNLEIPEVKKAFDEFKLLRYGQSQKEIKPATAKMLFNAKDDAFIRLTNALDENRGKLKLPAEMDEIKQANKIKTIGRDFFKESAPK